MSPSSTRWRPPVQLLSMRYLSIVPILLAIGTAIALFARSDVNAALLWSQCHAHERIPGLSKIPILGTPSCYLISFFRAALDSTRSTAVMSVILTFVGSLMMVSTVESARLCNASNKIISNPTAPWLLFNLAGGAVVWQLLIVPAFIIRARTLFLAEKEKEDNAGEEGDENVRQDHGGDGPLPDDRHHTLSDEGRHILASETIAIPVAVTLGYYVPSALMLSLNTPATIGVWLFFPFYVSVIRQVVRWGINRFRPRGLVTVHLESSWRRLLSVYAIPTLTSLISQVFFIWNLTKPDDRKEMTRSTVSFIEVDIQFIAWTVLYWVFVEVGWRVPLAMAVSSFVVGPGAATSLGWLYRESQIKDGLSLVSALSSSAEQDEEGPDETAPLLHS